MASAMAAKASRVERLFETGKPEFPSRLCFMLFPLLSDQFVQSCLTVPTLWATQPQASVCGSASTPADCFHWFSVSAACSFGHFVSHHHFAESPAMRLRHLYYQTNADSLSEWNCDICDISWRSERNSTTDAAHIAFAWLNLHYP